MSADTAAAGSSWDGTIASKAPESLVTNEDSAAQENQSRKSSSALRDQIAKAKAAKRAAMKQTKEEDVPAAGDEVSIIPADDGFDFGVGHDDPFNLKRGTNAGKKVLEQRLGAARSSGRLNIAAMGLKEIPAEVTKMYDLENIGPNGGSWAESVDITRLIAADNELEVLDELIFPDADPESFNDNEEGQGHIFGGLETLDLHGNLLVTVPLGFRRLNFLTSLNLVRL